jgi:hypothetical protein
MDLSFDRKMEIQKYRKTPHIVARTKAVTISIRIDQIDDPDRIDPTKNII